MYAIKQITIPGYDTQTSAGFVRYTWASAYWPQPRFLTNLGLGNMSWYSAQILIYIRKWIVSVLSSYHLCGCRRNELNTTLYTRPFVWENSLSCSLDIRLTVHALKRQLLQFSSQSMPCSVGLTSPLSSPATESTTHGSIVYRSPPCPRIVSAFYWWSVQVIYHFEVYFDNYRETESVVNMVRSNYIIIRILFVRWVCASPYI